MSGVACSAGCPNNAASRISSGTVHTYVYTTSRYHKERLVTFLAVPSKDKENSGFVKDKTFKNLVNRV